MKYFTVYKNSLSTFLQYRLNVGLILVSHLVSLSGLIVLWLSVYASGQQMGTYSLSAILLYYILVTVLTVTLGDGVGMGFEISDEINQGQVVNYLLRPISYLWARFYNLIGSNTINIILIGPLVVAIGYIGRNYYDLPSLKNWLIFVLFFVIATLMDFLVYFIASLSAFWLHRGQLMIYGVILVAGLLDGSLIPLDLYPHWAFAVIKYLPFQYLIFTPVQAFLGRVNNFPEMLILAICWLVVLYMFSLIFWRAGVRKFEAVGR